MYRSKLLNMAIQKSNALKYIEIGVKSGDTFQRIKCKQKIGVDPAGACRKLKFHIMTRWGAHFFKETSDEFFATHAKAYYSESEPLDVAYVDGLHTYKQSLKDVENCLKYLSPKGIIILHDCSPATEMAAIAVNAFEEREEKGYTGGPWNGDVWKTIVHLRSTRKDLDIFVLDIDHGLGVVTKKGDDLSNDNMLSYTPSQIEKMEYKDLKSNRVELLNLVPENHIWPFLDKFYSSNV